MTKEEQKATIDALLHERRGYELRVVRAEEAEDEEALEAAKARVEEVDAELKRLGAAAKRPSERAVSRPSEQRGAAASR